MLLSRCIPLVLHSVLKEQPPCPLAQGLLHSFFPSVEDLLLLDIPESISSSSSDVTFSTNRSLAALFQNCIPAPHPAPPRSTSHGLWWFGPWFGFYRHAYYLPTNNIVYNLLVILIVCRSLPTCKFHKGFVVVVDPTLLEKSGT